MVLPLTRSRSRSNRVTEQWRLAVDVGDGCKALLKTPQLMAPGIRRRIHKLFAETPHWRERRTELSRLYTDVPNAAIERGGGTDDRRVLRYKFFKARIVFLCPFRLQTHDDGAPHFDVRAACRQPSSPSVLACSHFGHSIDRTRNPSDQVEFVPASCGPDT